MLEYQKHQKECERIQVHGVMRRTRARLLLPAASNTTPSLKTGPFCRAGSTVFFSPVPTSHFRPFHAPPLTTTASTHTTPPAPQTPHLGVIEHASAHVAQCGLNV